MLKIDCPDSAVFSTFQEFPPSTVRYMPPLTLAMYATDIDNIDTAWGMRLVVDDPLGNTFITVQVVPPSSVRAAKLLAPITIAIWLLTCEME